MLTICGSSSSGIAMSFNCTEAHPFLHKQQLRSQRVTTQNVGTAYCKSEAADCHPSQRLTYLIGMKKNIMNLLSLVQSLK